MKMRSATLKDKIVSVCTFGLLMVYHAAAFMPYVLADDNGRRDRNNSGQAAAGQTPVLVAALTGKPKAKSKAKAKAKTHAPSAPSYPADPTFMPSDKVIHQMENSEGFYSYVYDDADKHYPHPPLKPGQIPVGFATTGHGERLPKQWWKSPYANGITREDADKLARRHIASISSQLSRAINPTVRQSLTQKQKDQIIDFGYNMGPYLGDTDFCKALNRGDFEEVYNQFGRYNHTTITRNGKKVKVVAKGLTVRRKLEADTYKPDIAVAAAKYKSLGGTPPPPHTKSTAPQPDTASQPAVPKPVAPKPVPPNPVLPQPVPPQPVPPKSKYKAMEPIPDPGQQPVVSNVTVTGLDNKNKQKTLYDRRWNTGTGVTCQCED
ncbi:MAG TPA: hypothetical protein V6C69_07575, partial [Trichormus sp.]